MAEAGTTPKKANPIQHDGDHDRVQMLSLKADGTPDQHNPEIIGDKEVALEATKEQFRQQAVSAVDAQRIEAASGVEDGPQDPSIQAATEAHEKAVAAAEKAAAKVVEELHRG